MGEVVEDEVMVSPGASLSAAERTATKSSAATMDLSKIRAGDEVTVRLRVIRYGPNDYRGLSYVVCEDGYGEHFSGPQDVVVLADRIVSHTPKALEVGDRVKWPNTRGTWEIAAIRDRWAWLADPEDKGLIAAVSDLERVDA